MFTILHTLARPIERVVAHNWAISLVSTVHLALLLPQAGKDTKSQQIGTPQQQHRQTTEPAGDLH